VTNAAKRRARKAAVATKRTNRENSVLVSPSSDLAPGSLVVRVGRGRYAKRRDSRLLLVLSVVKANNCLPQYLCQFCDTGNQRYFLPSQIMSHDKTL
jgi:hypothetical protein